MCDHVSILLLPARSSDCEKKQKRQVTSAGALSDSDCFINRVHLHSTSEGTPSQLQRHNAATAAALDQKAVPRRSNQKPELYVTGS